ncbi:hypothetical protein ACCO45_007604 [Purpureocillium lilacinum]|uniref:Uncharacterized protein n=1 Tax=Purpureocillium lilacinum TaxID=33203 RepID=A0ACC4DNK9_PURLI
MQHALQPPAMRLYAKFQSLTKVSRARDTPSTCAPAASGWRARNAVRLAAPIVSTLRGREMALR